MNRPTLYILCGPAGCGKSTWAHKYMETHPEVRYVSRDEIRFNLVKQDEHYFSHEKQVFSKFSSTIAQTLIDGFDVIADATHLNMTSRKKLTNAIDRHFTKYDIIYVVFNVPLATCITRNAKRSGRANVPNEVIENMYEQFHAPIAEDMRYKDYIRVGE